MCGVFQNHNENSPVPVVHSPEELQQSLSLLSISGLSNFELEDMFEEASNCLGESHLQTKLNISGRSTVLGCGTEHQTHLSLVSLIAGSESFRNRLGKLKTDPIFCSLMQSSLADFMSSSNIRELAADGKEIEITRVGAKVYASRECTKCIWYVLLSGKLKVTKDSMQQEQDGDDVSHVELNSGEIFGGYGLQLDSPDLVHVKIETMQSSKIIELNGGRLGEFVHRIPDIGSRLMSMMAGANFL